MDAELAPGLQLVVWIGLGAVLIAGLYLGHVQAKKRRAALGAFARELGWLFLPDKAYHLDDLRFPVFQRGRRRAAYNTLRGTLEIEGRRYDAQMGDYTFTEGSGKHQRTYRMSYALLTLPFPFVPDLHVRGEHLLDKVASAIGFDDIDFESAEFSGKFHVQSPDKRFAYDLIHPRMMEFLLKVEPPTIELRDRGCLLTSGLQVWELNQFRRCLWWAREFFQQWPAHLMERLEFQDRAGGAG